MTKGKPSKPNVLTGADLVRFVKALHAELKQYSYGSPQDAIERVNLTLHSEGFATNEAQLRATLLHGIPPITQKILSAECTPDPVIFASTGRINGVSRNLDTISFGIASYPKSIANSGAFLTLVGQGLSRAKLAYIWNLKLVEIPAMLATSVNIQYAQVFGVPSDYLEIHRVLGITTPNKLKELKASGKCDALAGSAEKILLLLDTPFSQADVDELAALYARQAAKPAPPKPPEHSDIRSSRQARDPEYGGKASGKRSGTAWKDSLGERGGVAPGGKK